MKKKILESDLKNIKGGVAPIVYPIAGYVMKTDVRTLRSNNKGI